MRFIIGIIICLFLLQASSAWAYAPTQQSCHERYSQSLDRGDRSIDVANLSPVVLTWELNSKTHVKSPQNSYTVEVNDQYGYFECSAELETFTLSGLQGRKECLRVTVEWRPGTDSSGCFVDIRKNGMPARRIQLYMNY